MMLTQSALSAQRIRNNNRKKLQKLAERKKNNKPSYPSAYKPRSYTPSYYQKPKQNVLRETQVVYEIPLGIRDYDPTPNKPISFPPVKNQIKTLREERSVIDTGIGISTEQEIDKSQIDLEFKPEINKENTVQTQTKSKSSQVIKSEPKMVSVAKKKKKTACCIIF